MKIILYVAMVLLMTGFALAVQEIISVEGVARVALTGLPVPVNTVIAPIITYTQTNGVSSSATPTTMPQTDSSGFFSTEITINNAKGPNTLHYLNIWINGVNPIANHAFYPAGGDITPIFELYVTYNMTVGQNLTVGINLTTNHLYAINETVQELNIKNYVNSYFLNGFAGALACRIANIEAGFPLPVPAPSNLVLVGNVDQFGLPFAGASFTGQAICDKLPTASKVCRRVIKFNIPQAATGQNPSQQFVWSFESVGCGIPATNYYLWLGPAFNHNQGNYFYAACCDIT